MQDIPVHVLKTNKLKLCKYQYIVKNIQYIYCTSYRSGACVIEPLTLSIFWTLLNVMKALVCLFFSHTQQAVTITGDDIKVRVVDVYIKRLIYRPIASTCWLMVQRFYNHPNRSHLHGHTY